MNESASMERPMTLNYTQADFIAEIKEKICLAQYEALKEVNTHLIHL
jgi:hypothetical protein